MKALESDGETRGRSRLFVKRGGGGGGGGLSLRA